MEGAQTKRRRAMGAAARRLKPLAGLALCAVAAGALPSAAARAAGGPSSVRPARCPVHKERQDLAPRDARRLAAPGNRGGVPAAVKGARACPWGPRPNLVLIMTDDQRYDTVTPEVMPNVRSLLGQHGLTFTNAFTVRSLCCPARASILTGRYAHNHGVLTNDPPFGGFGVFDDFSTVATWLHSAGYRTGLVGKYLNGYGSATGYGGLPTGPLYVPPGWDAFRVFALGSGYYDYTLNIDGQRLLTYGSGPGQYSTDVLKDWAIDFVRSAAPGERPFFLELTPYAPHPPGTPAPEDLGALADLPPNRPPSFNEQDVSDKPTPIQSLARMPEARIAALDSERLDQLRSLLAVDRAVGALVAELDRLGELDNTVIVFTSDNGYLWGEHRWEGKLVAYEESIRVPLLVRGPGVRTGATSAIAANVDIAPTLVELARASATSPMDGRSLVPSLFGRATGWRRDLMVEHWAGRATRIPDLRALYSDTPAGRYKYAEWTTDPPERELYDLDADPFEIESLLRQNSPAGPQLQPLVDELASRLTELADCAGPSCR